MSAPNIIPFREDVVLPERQSQNFKDATQELLKRVRRGEVSSLAFVEIRPNGTVTTWWDAGGNGFALIGGVSRLLHRLHEHSTRHEDDE